MTETVPAGPAAQIRAWARAWGPATLWLAVLFVLSHQPGDAVPSWYSVPDVVAHALLYGVLGTLMVLGRHWNGGRPGWMVLASVGLALAVLDEWHQSWVPGRTAAGGDVAADAFGLLVGGAAAALALRSLTPGVSPSRRNR